MRFHLTDKPWAIYCTSKTCQHSCVGRYRNRQDAQDQLKFLRKHVPQAEFVLLSDIKQEQSLHV
ncbi:hypothetical protein JYQ62_32020 [Nostoc sp. UHCC 0702]|nr:hypothetical protein JYQ62_32020 [Nostoc sp. UHCC 0702]